jgi:hypothetical protein
LRNSNANAKAKAKAHASFSLLITIPPLAFFSNCLLIVPRPHFSFMDEMANPDLPKEHNAAAPPLALPDAPETELSQ